MLRVEYEEKGKTSFFEVERKANKFIVKPDKGESEEMTKDGYNAYILNFRKNNNVKAMIGNL